MTKKEMINEIVNEYANQKTHLDNWHRNNLIERETKKLLRLSKESIEFVYHYFKKEQQEGHIHINFLMYQLRH